MSKRLLVVVVCVLVLGTTSVVMAQEGGDAERGAALYAENCLACHGPQGEARGTHEAFATTIQYNPNFAMIVTEGIPDTMMRGLGDGIWRAAKRC